MICLRLTVKAASALWKNEDISFLLNGGNRTLKGLHLTLARFARNQNVLRGLHVGSQDRHLDQLCFSK
jgi:hypothetical protein